MLKNTILLLILCTNSFKFEHLEEEVVHYLEEEVVNYFDEEVIQYLQKYGYLSQNKSIDDLKDDEYINALNKFQAFVGIDKNRESDQRVREMISRFRCGLQDIYSEDGKRVKRFVLEGKKWFPSDKVSLMVSAANDGVAGHWKQWLETAIKYWTDISNVKFVFTTEEPIFIHFDITDKNSSEGLVYDIQEVVVKRIVKSLVIEITDNNNNLWNNINATNLLIHTLGHALGLQHTSDESSVMYPYFSAKAIKALSVDDITGVQALYGINPTKPEVNYLNANPNRADLTGEDLCLSPKIDSVLEHPDGRWMFFKGEHYYDIGLVGQAVNSPRLIKWDYKEVETPIEATLGWSDGSIFLFKGDKYWKYLNQKFISSHKVSEGFKGIPNGPFDDVFQWNVNQKTYFFKGAEYWKYDSKTKSVPKGYPKKFADVWKGIPESFDAAVSSRKRNQTYFFKDKSYYRFDDISKKLIDDSVPPFPRLTQIWFLKCRNFQDMPKWPALATPPPLDVTTDATAETDEGHDETGWLWFFSLGIVFWIIVIIGTAFYAGKELMILKEHIPVNVLNLFGRSRTEPSVSQTSGQTLGGGSRTEPSGSQTSRTDEPPDSQTSQPAGGQRKRTAVWHTDQPSEGQSSSQPPSAPPRQRAGANQKPTWYTSGSTKTDESKL